MRHICAPILILWEREFRSREVKLQSSQGGRAASRPSYKLQATSYKCPQPASTQCPMSIHCQSPQTTLRSNFNRWGTRLAHLRELLSWATMRVYMHILTQAGILWWNEYRCWCLQAEVPRAPTTYFQQEIQSRKECTCLLLLCVIVFSSFKGSLRNHVSL